MCCKVDGMELCVFKWDKKVLSLLSIKRVEKTAFSLANTTEVVLVFDEIDVETGVNFEEIFSFAKERDAIRFVSDVEDAKRCGNPSGWVACAAPSQAARRKARAARVEAIEAAHLEQEAKRKVNSSQSSKASGLLPPVLPLRSAPHPAAVPSSNPVQAYDPFSTAPPLSPPAAAPSAPVPAAVAFDPFSTSMPPAAPAFDLLDEPRQAPRSPVDPFGFTLADPVVAPPPSSDPFAASSMAPLAAALPRTPATSGTRPRLGEAPKPKSADPFANLMDL